jgi:uncharacterized membrane protein
MEPDMSPRQRTALLILGLLATLIILAQIFTILTTGKSFCPNDGCEVVHDLTRVSQTYINLAGIIYFQLLFWLTVGSRQGHKHRHYLFDAYNRPQTASCSLLQFLLLMGMVAEGVLVCFQLFVVKTVCLYCFIVFGFIILMNAALGARQLLKACIILGTQITVFAALNFNTSTLNLDELSMDKGTYAVKSCEKPRHRMYLVFSENCPHCQAVLKELSDCSLCEFHFNPVTRLTKAQEIFKDLPAIQDYNPEVNKAMLKMLGIYTIPILISETSSGLELVKGQENIVNYVRDHCILSETPKGLDSLFSNPLLPTEDQEGACQVEKECK